jgi:ATP-dependent Lon protease
MKAIQQELGEGEGAELVELRARIDAASLPESIYTVATREVERLSRMTGQSPEYQMIRTYLDWILELPWPVTTEDRLDPVEARRVLDDDHYDLDKVKERIVEYPRRAQGRHERARSLKSAGVGASLGGDRAGDEPRSSESPRR